MQWGSIVLFEDHPNPFLVEDSYCQNPECDCNSVIFKLHEISDCGEEVHNPISVHFCVDLESWEESDPPARRPEKGEAWIKEFLAGYSAERRTETRLRYDREKRLARRLADYRIDPQDILEGKLISHSDLLSESGAISHGGGGFLHRQWYNEMEFLIEDLYCPNPACDCREMHLQFWQCEVEERDGTEINKLSYMFRAAVTFSGDRKVASLEGCTAELAQVLLNDWWNRHGADLPVFQEHYDEIREIAQRSLDAAEISVATARQPKGLQQGSPLLLSEAGEPVLELLNDSKRVGRNDRCPCGSGRKYKKCCGAAGRSLQRNPR